VSDWREQSRCENVSVFVVVICVTSGSSCVLLFHFQRIEIKLKNRGQTLCYCVYVSLQAIGNKRELINGVWLLHESQSSS